MELAELRKKIIDMMEGDLDADNAAEFQVLMAKYLKAGGTEEELVYSFLELSINEAMGNSDGLDGSDQEV